jgi:hypothetical protein
MPRSQYFVTLCCWYIIVGIASVLASVSVVSRPRDDGLLTGSVDKQRIAASTPNLPEKVVQRRLQSEAKELWRPPRQSSALPADNVTGLTQASRSEASHHAYPEIHGCTSTAPSVDRAPWQPMWNNTLALCATMRQENATDVVEWLSYYKCVPSTCRCQELSRVWSIAHL